MSKASKNDKSDNKPDYSLIPKVLMDQLAYVMMAGAEKYGRFNYTKGHSLTQLTAAATRHLKQIEAGQDIDPDTSGRVGVDVHHAANVCANMLMLLHQRQLGTLTDDRFSSDLDGPLLPNTGRVIVEYTEMRPYYGGGEIGQQMRTEIAASDLPAFRKQHQGVRVLSYEAGTGSPARLIGEKL